jgi:hypothetical protein
VHKKQAIPWHTGGTLPTKKRQLSTTDQNNSIPGKPRQYCVVAFWVVGDYWLCGIRNAKVVSSIPIIGTSCKKRRSLSGVFVSGSLIKISGQPGRRPQAR